MIASEPFKLNLVKLIKSNKCSVERKVIALYSGNDGLVTIPGLCFVERTVCTFEKRLLILVREQRGNSRAQGKAGTLAVRPVHSGGLEIL